jgi:hypothetical protein
MRGASGRLKRGKVSMSHPELIEGANHIEVRSPMRAGMRVVVAIVGLFPLLAPYDLLVRVEWQQHMHLAFLFAAVVSAGAMALSALLLFAAVAGLSSAMVFDKVSGTFTYTAKAPILRRFGQTHRLSQIHDVSVVVRDWSDGAPTYHLRIVLADGAVFESGASWSQDEVETMRARVQRFLA